MKIKSSNLENVKNYVDPSDKARAAESGNVNRIAEPQGRASAGVGDLKSKFETAKSQTALDKMINGKNPLPDPAKSSIAGVDECIMKAPAGVDECIMKVPPGVDECIMKVPPGVDECIMKVPPGVDECIMKVPPGVDEGVEPEDLKSKLKLN